MRSDFHDRLVRRARGQPCSSIRQSARISLEIIGTTRADTVDAAHRT